MKTITVIQVEDWFGLWVDGELRTEGHNADLSDLSHAADGELFKLNYVAAGETAAEREVLALGGFQGVTLDKWLSLAEEPA